MFTCGHVNSRQTCLHQSSVVQVRRGFRVPNHFTPCYVTYCFERSWAADVCHGTFVLFIIVPRAVCTLPLDGHERQLWPDNVIICNHDLVLHQYVHPAKQGWCTHL